MIYKTIRHIIFLITILFTFSKSTDFLNKQFGVIINAGKHFSIFEISANDQTEYRYVIYKEGGEIAKTENTFRRCPEIKYIFNETALSISIAVGTGTDISQYYDINQDIFSHYFESPLLVEYGKVCYIDYWNNDYKLVVSNPFDEKEYYVEYILEMSPVANPKDAVKFVEFINETELKIIYLSGVNYLKKTEIFYLPK